MAVAGVQLGLGPRAGAGWQLRAPGGWGRLCLQPRQAPQPVIHPAAAVQPVQPQPPHVWEDDRRTTHPLELQKPPKSPQGGPGAIRPPTCPGLKVPYRCQGCGAGRVGTSLLVASESARCFGHTHHRCVKRAGLGLGLGWGLPPTPVSPLPAQRGDGSAQSARLGSRLGGSVGFSCQFAERGVKRDGVGRGGSWALLGRRCLGGPSTVEEYGVSQNAGHLEKPISTFPAASPA